MRETYEPAPTTINREPIRFLIDPLQRFLLIEAADGGILLVAATLALVIANSPFGDAFLAFWQQTVGLQVGTFHVARPLPLWLKDGLMAVFFFVVGLEVKRAFGMGALREFKHAALPIAAEKLWLVLDKPNGIVAFNRVAVKAKRARRLERARWASLAGGGMLAGIGFAMALLSPVRPWRPAGSIMSRSAL